MADADEWTFVSHSKNSSKRRRNGRHHGKGRTATTGGNGGGGGSGLYRASVDGIITKKYPPHQQEQVGDNNHDSDRITNDILACLHALENQWRGGNGFAFCLVTSMAMATSSSSDTQDGDNGVQQQQQDETKGSIRPNKTTPDSERHLHLREIVAYGIGNFATERFQAPMLQLACLLLLRRSAANAAADNSLNQSTTDDFESEQKSVPIYYYEPFILPVEKKMLEETFHVHVLESNDMGKRTVESMRQQHQFIVPLSKPTTQTALNSNFNHAHTLFYMPHCPMRLYCNVLHAHWHHIFPTINDGNKTPMKEEPLVVLGNSFYAYEERTISSEKRADPTNGVFSIVPFAREVSVGVSNAGGGRRNGGYGGDIVVDELRHLGVAFNDCSVISFPLSGEEDDCVGRDEKKEKEKWPDRPEEWFASEDAEKNGELM